MVVDESNQKQICAGNSNAKRVEAESAVIADKSAHFDVTEARRGGPAVLAENRGRGRGAGNLQRAGARRRGADPAGRRAVF